MPWSLAQQRQLAIWPKVTGSLSIMGSASIIYEVLRDKKKRRKVYHRIMLAMSLIDVNTSFWYALSTWPMPKDTQGVAYASGTQQSCTAQGFFVQLGLATPMYNVALAIYYCIVVRYHWKEHHLTSSIIVGRHSTRNNHQSPLDTENLEPPTLGQRFVANCGFDKLFYCLPIIFTSATAFASLGLELFNSAGLVSIMYPSSLRSLPTCYMVISPNIVVSF